METVKETETMQPALDPSTENKNSTAIDSSTASHSYNPLLIRFDEVLKQLNIEPLPLHLTQASTHHLTLVSEVITQALHQHVPMSIPSSMMTVVLQFLQSLTCEYLLPIHALAIYTVVKQHLLETGLVDVNESNVETIVNKLYSILTIQTTLLCNYGGSEACLNILLQKPSIEE